MSTELESPQKAETQDLGEPELAEAYDAEVADFDYGQYRALSSLAVVSCAMGVLSVLAIADWAMTVVPLVGIVSGFVALRRIRKNPNEYTGERLALAGVVLSMVFMLGGWTRLSYVYATEVPDGYDRISYDTLQPNADEGEIVPPAAIALNGKKVFIKGYVYQPSGGQLEGLTQFVLVRDKGDCCFGGNPKMTDMILVKLQPPLKAKFDMRVRKLAGTFRVAPGVALHGLGGVVYHLDADHLE